jgi:hypothetical protein
LVLAGCASGEGAVLGDCPFPDTYVAHLAELSGDCGAMLPSVQRSGEPVPPECTVTREMAECFVTTRYECAESPAGYSFLRRSWLDGADGTWSGEATYMVERYGMPYCRSTYAVTIEAR